MFRPNAKRLKTMKPFLPITAQDSAGNFIGSKKRNAETVKHTGLLELIHTDVEKSEPDPFWTFTPQRVQVPSSRYCRTRWCTVAKG